MRALVSVVIPCFNAEKWIAQAVHSALSQTYLDIEVVVVDDGSTDRSLELIRSFGSTIRWEGAAHRGGNHARNRGLGLSRGEYIQFLDADDYLLPEKIARQVELMQLSGADVIYEDWQRLQENCDGKTAVHPPEIAGPQLDVLEALVGSWAPPPCAFLYKRDVVERVAGWDEELSCAQDWELNVRIALSGATYQYLPGCHSVYRRPATYTVSTKDGKALHQTIISVLKKVEETLTERAGFESRYRRAMAGSYLTLARCYYETDREAFGRLVGEARRLSNAFAYKQPLAYRLLASAFGVGIAESAATFKRSLGRARMSKCITASLDH